MIDILTYFLAGGAFFLRIVYWCVIADVILSWLPLLGIQIVVGPLKNITQPLYSAVRKIIPTQLGPIDIAPLLVLLFIDVLAQIGIPGLVSLLHV